MSREAWSAMFMIFGLVDGGFLMAINGAPADISPEASLATRTHLRPVALFLAGAAQPIAIPVRVSPGRLGVLLGHGFGAVNPWGRAGFARKKV